MYDSHFFFIFKLMKTLKTFIRAFLLLIAILSIGGSIVSWGSLLSSFNVDLIIQGLLLWLLGLAVLALRAQFYNKSDVHIQEREKCTKIDLFSP